MMMNVETLKRAFELVKEIEQTQKLISAYREADEVAISTGKINTVPQPNPITMTAAEIGDHIVAALERRVTEMQAELQKLGVAD